MAVRTLTVPNSKGRRVWSRGDLMVQPKKAMAAPVNPPVVILPVLSARAYVFRPGRAGDLLGYTSASLGVLSPQKLTTTQTVASILSEPTVFRLSLANDAPIKDTAKITMELDGEDHVLDWDGQGYATTATAAALNTYLRASVDRNLNMVIRPYVSPAPPPAPVPEPCPEPDPLPVLSPVPRAKGKGKGWRKGQ